MTTTVAEQAPARSAGSSYRLSFGGVLKSEFLKFRTVLSSWILLVITGVLMVGFAALRAWSITVFLQATRDAMPKEIKANPEASQQYMDSQMGQFHDMAMGSPAGGIVFATLVLVSLAAIVIAGEFGSKAVISTLTAAPRRGAVYLAKMVVLSVWAAVLGLVTAVLGWLVAQPILAKEHLDYGFFEAKTWENFGGIVLVFVLVTWMGLGLGGLLRNSAGAIVLGVGILFVLPIIVSLFAGAVDWVEDFQHYIPWNLIDRLTSVGSDGTPTKPVAGLWYAVWCVVPLVLGYFSFTQRDPK